MGQRCAPAATDRFAPKQFSRIVADALRQEFQPLCRQFGIENIDSRHVAAWPCEAGDQPVRDQVAAADENDRDRRGCVLRRACGNDAADCYDRVDLTTDEIAGQAHARCDGAVAGDESAHNVFTEDGETEAGQLS